MSMNTAKHAGLEGRVGQLLPGYRADIVIWNPEEKFKVSRINGINHVKARIHPLHDLRKSSGVMPRWITSLPNAASL